MGSNCSVTVYHTDDGKEQFSSFERFKMYDCSSLSPVENIRIKYDFLIVLPKTEKAQQYNIEINIVSRAAMHARTSDDADFPDSFIFRIATRTGSVNIEYIDYTVARNFMLAIENWFQGLPQTSHSRVSVFLKKHSGHIPFLFRYLSAIFLTIWFFSRANQ